MQLNFQKASPFLFHLSDVTSMFDGEYDEKLAAQAKSEQSRANVYDSESHVDSDVFIPQGERLKRQLKNRHIAMIRYAAPSALLCIILY